MIATLVVNGIAVVSLLIAFAVSGEKTVKSLKIAARSFVKILPTVSAIILVIGLIQGFIPPNLISKFLGEQSGIGGVLLIGLMGAVMHIPAIISFPLAASLLENGASVTAVATFITTLTMVGVVTFPLEAKILGKKLAILRNGLSFVIAMIIGLIMGVVL